MTELMAMSDDDLDRWADGLDRDDADEGVLVPDEREH